jgi:hypothetical protein
VKRSGSFVAAAVGVLLAFGTVCVQAHHAFTAQYDPARRATLTGVVVKIEWLNPHAYFYVDVTDEETGEIETWACELGSPVGLMRRGWTRNSLKIGDVVTVEGVLARDDSAALNARSVVLTGTGRRLFARDSEPAARTEEKAAEKTVD